MRNSYEGIGGNNNNEIPPIINEGKMVTDELFRNSKSMKISPDDARQIYRKIKNGYEELQASGSPYFNEMEMNELDEAYNLYERSRDEFNESKNNAFGRIRGSTTQSAESSLSFLRRLESESRLGEQIVVSKRGLTQIVDLFSGLSNTTDISKINDELSGISTLCEIDTYINAESISENEKDDLREIIRKTRSYLEDLAEELKQAGSLVKDINVDGYEEFGEKLSRLGSKAYEASDELSAVDRRLHY